ncbi:MAG: aspartate kinase, monofunctional class [Anaerocolumna sp.]|jgi:aspartate kinase|nr:aspartate kinase, monofunctional class [Anaerocolumna sp.]
MLIVKKFGGTSVADKEKIMNVADICVKEYEKGNQVVVVLSAMGKQTDELLAQAKEINPKAPKREIDMLLTTGEQISVALMAMALDRLGVPAISFNAFQVGISTTNHYGNASIKEIDINPIRHELDMGKIVIITGFQGINDRGDYTTLGRGGSDTTAVALAAALSADACEIYTDVDGVYTTDPRIVPGARKLEEINHDEMLELASLGAGVLHNRSVEVAKKFNVPLVVRSSLNNRYGTVVKDKTELEKRIIKGVTTDDNAAFISLKKIAATDSTALQVFKHLAVRNINADVILFSENQGTNSTNDVNESYALTADLKFLVSKDNLGETIEVLKDQKESLKYEELIVEEDISKVSIVGIGVMSDPMIAPKLFEAFYEEKIPIKMVSTSEIKITVVINQEFTVRAIKAVHDKFKLS